MHAPTYAIGRAAGRFVSAMYVRHRVVHPERLRRAGPFLLACTHIGHLEPILLSGWMTRPVHWVAREEFFRFRPAASVLRRLGAIEIDRFGVPVRAVRESIRRLGRGEIVGIFPEGGRTHGNGQAVRGGRVRGGVATIAMRAGVPVVPVVMLGLDAMQAVGTWVPGRRTTVRTIVGEAIAPAALGTRTGRRARRQAMTAEVAAAFISLYQELTGEKSPGSERPGGPA